MPLAATKRRNSVFYDLPMCLSFVIHWEHLSEPASSTHAFQPLLMGLNMRILHSLI